MPPFHKWTRPRGSVHNVDHALALAESGCNILIVSDATLYAIQNLVALDLTFMSRWADQIFDFGYNPITPDSANYDQWVDLVHQIQSEVVDMSCEIVPVLEEIRDNQVITNATLQDVKDALVAQTTALDPDDTLIDDLEPIMDAINVILGGAAILGG
jgi:hypothetical protein